MRPVRALVLLTALAAPASALAQQPPAQQPPACLKEFVALRDEAQKKAGMIKAASERKATPTEACGLIKTFVEAEAKVVKYAADQGVWCGIPPQAVEQMRQTHSRSVGLRNKVCQAAAAGPQRPAGPSLSDALGTPTTPSQDIKPGRGTFDTLTGTPLGGAR